jgi:hypothetical protein
MIIFKLNNLGNQNKNLLTVSNLQAQLLVKSFSDILERFQDHFGK